MLRSPYALPLKKKSKENDEFAYLVVLRRLYLCPAAVEHGGPVPEPADRGRGLPREDRLGDLALQLQLAPRLNVALVVSGDERRRF